MVTFPLYIFHYNKKGRKKNFFFIFLAAWSWKNARPITPCQCPKSRGPCPAQQPCLRTPLNKRLATWEQRVRKTSWSHLIIETLRTGRILPVEVGEEIIPEFPTAGAKTLALTPWKYWNVYSITFRTYSEEAVKGISIFMIANWPREK